MNETDNQISLTGTTKTHQRMIDDFNALFSNEDLFATIAVGDAVDLPQSKTEPEELYHCNLRQPEWAYHTKLTHIAEDFFQRGLKQKQIDREM